MVCAPHCQNSESQVCVFLHDIFLFRPIGTLMRSEWKFKRLWKGQFSLMLSLQILL